MTGIRRDFKRRFRRDPRRPARPISSFLFYFKHHRKAVENSPLVNSYRQAMLAMVAGKMWKTVSPKLKKEASVASLAARKKYQQAMKSYTPPTPEQLQYIDRHWPKRFRN
jgi:hypothetical protein